MERRILLIMGLAFLLAGCTNGDEPRKESTKETTATITTTSTENKLTATSTETADTSTSSESFKMTETAQTFTPDSSLEASSPSSESSEQVEQTLQNADKIAQLGAFMTTWGQTMGQQYESYTNQMSVDLYSPKIPQAILNEEWRAAIGGVPASAEWSESGTGQADYQITVVHSDVETKPYLKKHVYLFRFQQNQPKVLVTQQNQGNPDNCLYFNGTANDELKDGFSQIVYE